MTLVTKLSLIALSLSAAATAARPARADSIIGRKCSPTHKCPSGYHCSMHLKCEARGPLSNVSSHLKGLMPEHELEAVYADVKTNYADLAQKAKALAASTHKLSAAEKQKFAALTKTSVAKMKPFIHSLKERWTAVHADPKNKALLTRLMKKAAKKKIDDEVRRDMETLAELLGLATWKSGSLAPKAKWASADAYFNPPQVGEHLRWADGPMADLVDPRVELSAAQQSPDLPGSFFIGFGASGGVVAGAEFQFGFQANCYKNHGEKYGVAFFTSLGGILGAVEGVAAGVEIGWAPGGVDRASGAYVAAGLGGGYKFGAKVQANWSVDWGKRGLEAQGDIPSVSLEVGGAIGAEGVEVEVESAGGYTWAFTN